MKHTTKIKNPFLTYSMFIIKSDKKITITIDFYYIGFTGFIRLIFLLFCSRFFVLICNNALDNTRKN